MPQYRKIAMFTCTGKSPCDLSIFGQCVNNAGGRIWFHPTYNLIPRWNKYVDCLGNYIEN